MFQFYIDFTQSTIHFRYSLTSLKSVVMRSKPEVSPKITLETETIFEDPAGESEDLEGSDIKASTSGTSSLKASTRTSISTNRSR